VPSRQPALLEIVGLDPRSRGSDLPAILGAKRDAMRSNKALIRLHIERIDGVSRTWIEWESADSDLTKTLVVEVDFDTDPINPTYRQNVMDAILDAARSLRDDTTMVVSALRIVPKE
jgi:hypothetical protein